MNIKSLLAGSALAAAGVTGAQAADIITVPEPEPVEYVRVCDVYGAGFFYIPGTETCLKIGGYVRYQIDWSDEDDGWRKLARATLTVDARSETEYGTLGGFIEIRGETKSGFNSSGPVDGIQGPGFSGQFVRVQQAIISLGGLAMGLSDTLYDAGLSGEFDEGGGDRVHFIRYTFEAGNGVHFTLAAEEQDYNYDYTPNVVGNVGLTQGWGSLNGWVAYDATEEEWAAKAIAKIKLSQPLTLEAMATYESGQNWYSVGGPDDGYEWTVAGYLKYAATPKLSVGFGGQYFAESHADGFDDYAIGGVIDYALVENFNTKIAINYFDGDTYDAFNGGDGVFSGFVRFDRNF